MHRHRIFRIEFPFGHQRLLPTFVDWEKHAVLWAGAEGQCKIAPVDEWVVNCEPGQSQDHSLVRRVDDIEGQHFAVSSSNTCHTSRCSLIDDGIETATVYHSDVGRSSFRDKQYTEFASELFIHEASRRRVINQAKGALAF